MASSTASSSCAATPPGRPIVLDRLTRTDDGTILYKLKRRYRNGSTHVVFSPHTLIERLCALIPRPRRHLVTYHGVLAPAAGLRDRVVPDPVDRSGGEDRDQGPPDSAIQRLGLGSRPPPPVPHARHATASSARPTPGPNCSGGCS
ncbi:MAG: transposase [Planctomycetota bacterium]